MSDMPYSQIPKDDEERCAVVLESIIAAKNWKLRTRDVAYGFRVESASNAQVEELPGRITTDLHKQAVAVCYYYGHDPIAVQSLQTLSLELIREGIPFDWGTVRGRRCLIVFAARLLAMYHAGNYPKSTVVVEAAPLRKLTTSTPEVPERGDRLADRLRDVLRQEQKDVKAKYSAGGRIDHMREGIVAALAEYDSGTSDGSES